MLSGRSFAPSSSMRVVPPVSVSVATALFSFLLTREDPDLRPYVGGIAVEDLGYARAHRVEILDALAYEDDDHLPTHVVLAEPDAGNARHASKLCFMAAQNLRRGDVSHRSPPRDRHAPKELLGDGGSFPARIASRSNRVRSRTAPPLESRRVYNSSCPRSTSRPRRGCPRGEADRGHRRHELQGPLPRQRIAPARLARPGAELAEAFLIHDEVQDQSG